MKKLSIYILSLVLVVSYSCNKSFLNKVPQIQFTTSTVFTNYANFQTYALGLYDYFDGYTSNVNTYPGNLVSEYYADNLSYTTGANQSPYSYQTKIIPVSNANNTPTGASSSGAGTSFANSTPSLGIANWDFSYVRAVNVMLDNIDQSQMAQGDKNHWRAVGYFFRALRYYDLIAAFGDVPWIEHSLGADSTNILMAARTPRDTVAQNILSNLEWAEANIGSSTKDGANSINQACVQFLLSRFGLFEGTWRKYHNLANANTYLQACVTYSAKLMASYPTIMSSYDNVYNTNGLVGQPGIILVKQYAPNIVSHGYGPGFIGGTSWHMDVTKDAVESYLCTDGRPISTSTVYKGDTSMYNVFANRDRRLYYTVTPPYKVTNPGSANSWNYTGSPRDSVFINLMAQITSPTTGKYLPLNQQSRTMQTGLVINMVPHFREFPGGQPQAVSELGYFYWKLYNRFGLDNTNKSDFDCPIFRIEEVLLNDAEAEFELGAFTQAVADQTINKLRPRANLPNMIVANIDANFDLNRDPSVSPVLWEIRRERRVELMGDGLRFNDLKRWGKGNYLSKQPLGVWVNNAEFGNHLTISGGGQSGYVQFYGVPSGWLDKYYFEPIPSQELLLNPNLKQSPGW